MYSDYHSGFPVKLKSEIVCDKCSLDWAQDTHSAKLAICQEESWLVKTLRPTGIIIISGHSEKICIMASGILHQEEKREK